MTENAPIESTAEGDPKRPRRRWVFWLITGVAIFAVPATFILFMFGPDPPIRVAKETTYLTEPLADDGLPDYVAALIDEGREGVTPENNGALPFLEVVWQTPGTSDAIAQNAEEAEWLLETLGVEDLSDGSVRLKPLYAESRKLQALRFLRAKLEPMTDAERSAVATAFEDYYYDFDVRKVVAEDEEEALSLGAADGLIDYCTPVGRPWTRDDLPWLADWREANTPAFERLYEAGRRPRWWLPSPSLSSSGRGDVIAMLLTHIQELRNVARMLQNDALWHLGNARYTEAANSIETMLRLAQHTRTEFSLIGQLVACAIEGIAHTQCQRIASDPNAPAEALRSLLATLESIESRSHVARSMTTGERMWALDMVTSVAATGDLASLDLDNTGPGFILRNVSIDWNVVLETMNRRYDQLGAAMAQPTWQTRSDALTIFEQELDARISEILPSSPMDVLSVITSQRERGRIAAGIIESLMLPAVSACATADARVTANRQLTEVMLRIAIHRSETGAYPDNLSPEVSATPPTDTFQGEPLVYEKTEDGFLLYSLGANGIDDGGSREQGSWGQSQHRGVELEDDADPRHAKIPGGADDIALRLPVTYEPFPWEVSPVSVDR